MVHISSGVPNLHLYCSIKMQLEVSHLEHTLHTVPSIKICILGNPIAAPQSSGFMVSCVYQEDT
jgi:hypothetical protein